MPGSGTSKSNQDTNQSQTSQTAPWAATQPALNGIMSGINGQIGNYGPNGAESGALNTLQQNAQNTPNYAPQAQGLANDLMGGGGTAANAGILSDAYKNYQSQLNPIANQNNDPMNNPGMRSILDTIRSDVSDSVNGMFAGAGRDMSGMNQQALGRGIAQGQAPVLLDQYNRNVQNQMGAAGSLYGAGGATAQGLQGFNQQGFDNRAQGLDVGINGVQAAQNAGANNVLGAAGTARQLPLQNLGMLSNLTIPIAGLGSQSSGTMTGQTRGTQTDSPMRQFMQFGQGLGGMFGTAGGGGAGGLMNFGTKVGSMFGGFR